MNGREAADALYGGKVPTVTMTLPTIQVRDHIATLSTLIRYQQDRIRKAEADGSPPQIIANLQGPLQDMARFRAALAPYVAD